MPRQRILMISAQFIPEVFGGAVNQCFKLSRQLSSEGYEVTVLTSRNNFKLPAHEVMDGVKVVRLWTGKPPQFMGKYTWSSIVWLAECIMWGLKNKKRFDILHIHQGKFQAYVGVVLGKLLHKPSIVKVGNADFNFDLESLKRKKIIGGHLYSMVKNNITLFVAISNQIKKNFIDHGVNEARIINIPNGVNQLYTYSDIQNKKKELRAKLFNETGTQGANSKYFLSAGRLSKEKNIPLLINLFSEVIITNPSIRLVILGDGDMWGEIQNLIKEKKAEGYILCTGYVKNVSDYMMASDFFVLPSEIEGMSNSLLEAMSMALIPIATNISGSADLIVDRKNGFLADKPWNINYKHGLDICAKMDYNAISAMQKESYNAIKENYTIQAISKKYASLYNGLQSKSDINN